MFLTLAHHILRNSLISFIGVIFANFDSLISFMVLHDLHMLVGIVSYVFGVIACAGWYCFGVLG